MNWYYERMKADGAVEEIHVHTNDTDGSITGRVVINVKAWFDENPEERIRLGWTKHITFDENEVKERWPHNSQSQYLVKTIVQVDDYTVEDTYYVMDKSEEQMLLEEISESLVGGLRGTIFFR